MPTSELESPSSRRAWIEICVPSVQTYLPMVALLAEGVDRNWILCSSIQKQKPVALLAEGVDRNGAKMTETPAPMSRPPRGGRG